jgi:hypothetical protein
VAEGASAAACARRRARRRIGVAITYSTMLSGMTPYSKKVKTAPRTVPFGAMASTSAIIVTT